MQTNAHLVEKIEEVLTQIRPYLQADGGDVSFVEITNDKRVILKLLGACQTCNMSHMTMKAGIEDAIKKSIPEIKSVESLTTLASV
ncbi:MAG: NifU family protein [Bacteroidetes bacterium]|nr:NifU family protein [Bacteroidota bacterium]